MQAEEVEMLISELAKVTGGERALVEECGGLLYKTHTFQVCFSPLLMRVALWKIIHGYSHINAIKISVFWLAFLSNSPQKGGGEEKKKKKEKIINILDNY